MSANTSIEWTDATWNPIRGCTKISPGCKHCYAEVFAERFRGVPGHPYGQGFDLRLVSEKLAEPLRWTKPRHIFVNSMSDLFHEDVPDDYIAAVFGVMAAAHWHRFQVLTKRAERMRDWFGLRTAPGASVWPLPNVGLGVSVEDRTYGVPRIEVLRQTPAALRTLSIEPLLEDLGELDLSGIGWVLIGGESGHGARRCEIGWIRSIVRQCRAQGALPFVKQLGRVATADAIPMRLADRKGKQMPEWPPDLRVRESPFAAVG